MRILVAGIGNIFFGDDAFGCEVAKELTRHSLPESVRVIDFGIRSYDLAYAIMEHDATVLIDALSRGTAPGTVFLVEPERKMLDEGGDEVVNAHSMNPLRVLQLVRSLGGPARRVLVVGCEPATLESTGELGLSPTVQRAVPAAVQMVEELIGQILTSENFVKGAAT